MATIITQTRNDNEYVYPRTYALAVFLNNGQTSMLEAVGDTWSTADKNLKGCSDLLNTITGSWNNNVDKNLKNCSDDIKILTSKISDLESKIASLTSRISNLESKSNS